MKSIDHVLNALTIKNRNLEKNLTQQLEYFVEFAEECRRLGGVPTWTSIYGDLLKLQTELAVSRSAERELRIAIEDDAKDAGAK